MEGLLCHTATVSKNTDTVVNGRVTHVDTPLGSVSCRFTQPKTSLIALMSADIERVDAVVFAGPDYLAMIGTTRPIKLVTTDPGVSGTYVMKYPPRVYPGYDNSVHHVEFDVWRDVT